MRPMMIRRLVSLLLCLAMLALPQPLLAALVRCADCGRMVSSIATSCPGCGRPIAEGEDADSEPKESSRPATPTKASFKLVRGALVLVQSGGQTGSGFIVEVEGQLYVITNTHVLENLQTLTLRNLAGEKFKYGKVEFANEQDLVRIRLLPTKIPVRPLTFSDEEPSVDDIVVVHGNSQGSDVVTELTGRVMGIGPGKIEVDAEFVQGNSGSPVLNAQGEVIAVATYVTQTSESLDWVADNTRFAKPRRFGITVGDIDWVTVDARKLRPQLALLSDVEDLVGDLALLLENWRPYSDMRPQAVDMLHNYSADQRVGSYTNTGWPQDIEKFCKAYVEMSHIDARVNQQGRKTAQVSRNSFQYRRLGEDRDRILQALCREAATRLGGAKWSTDYFKAQAAEYEELLGVANKSLQQAMKSTLWGRYVRPEAIPNEWGARPGLQQ